MRRRHRRMVEEAVRNGTWMPPTPPARASRIDLSKKPELWEAYLGDGSWQLGSYGQGSSKELEYSRDWESIKPIYAGYVEPQSSTTDLTSPSPPVPIPIPTPIFHSASRGDVEENRRAAEVSTDTPPSFLTRARIFLNFNSSNVPVSSSSADNGRNSHSNSVNISMTELSSTSSPPTIRVAVLIAMPSPPSSHGSSTTPLSASISSKSQPQSHPLELPSSVPTPTTLKFADDEELPLPLLEMGVADVQLVTGRSGDSTSWDSSNTEHSRREEKTTYSRGSSYAEP